MSICDSFAEELAAASDSHSQLMGKEKGRSQLNDCAPRLGLSRYAAGVRNAARSNAPASLVRASIRATAALTRRSALAVR